ncbi:hypothetical protein [Spirochaeta dissipatitropha]
MSEKKHDYLRDVQTIKGILEEREDRVLLPPWSFFSWAVVMLLGLGASLLAVSNGWGAQQVALRIWTAAILLGGLCESFGWLQYLRRNERAFLTSSHIKLLSSFMGVVFAACGIAFSLALRGVDISAELLLLLSICFFLLGIFTFKALFIESYVLLAAGLILMLLRALGLADSESLYIASALMVSAAFIVAGIHTGRVMKRRHG